MASSFQPISKYQMKQNILYLSCCYFLFLMPTYADVDKGTDTLLQGQSLRDGEYLNSANKIFRLQFFDLGAFNNKYLGIFYKNESDLSNILSTDPYPVWVANRDTPIPNSSVVLEIDTADGLLKISYDGGNTTVSNSTPTAKNTSATILDNGNLVLRLLNPDDSINRTLWQSFDYPTDTFLPGMKIGINLKTGHKWSLTSWISPQEPGSGSLTLGGDPNGLAELVILWQGNLYWTGGVLQFKNLIYGDFSFTYVSNENERYFTYPEQGNFSFFKTTINSTGRIVVDREHYGFSAEPCPVSGPRDAGCVNMLPKCRKADPHFYQRIGKSVGSGNIYLNLSQFDCAVKCRRNCSCIAFKIMDSYRPACELFDKFYGFSPSEEGEQGEVVYFLETKRARRWWIWLSVAVGGTLLLMSIFCYFIRKYIKEKTEEKILLQELADTSLPPGQHSGVIDKIGKKMKNQVHIFSFESLEMATDNFATKNKLGEGGFGSVFKGKLPSGQEIAIKRLSRSSGQGLLEFKNEILLIAKLQHDNLVKLLGCCIKGKEKILVYEYMPNGSLDFFLFAPSRRESIKWNNRMNIIEGVAQGLLYLHKYSRLRVIHRDLKASNILLDQNMNPKISDFGMARIFGKQDSEANTKRIVGTYGYMSPEYAIKGIFSEKSDVFSFGVLLLEIVCGKKNHGRYHSERPLNLIGFAWELWIEGKAIELIDPTLDASDHKNEILRCINIGLLCVQDNATNRPSMIDVITMLKNESFQLPEPKQPAFFIDTSTQDAEKEMDVERACTNDVSISDMEGR